MKVDCLTQEMVVEMKRRPRTIKAITPLQLKDIVYSSELANLLLDSILEGKEVDVIIRDEALRPCIYICISEFLDVLYIGSSRQGLQRVFSSTKADVTTPYRNQAMAETFRVIVAWCDTVQQAQIAESQLIKAFQPPYNTKGK